MLIRLVLAAVLQSVFNPDIQIGFAVSDDFSQFDKRQAVSVRHSPDGKRVDFHADVNGGVSRCH